MLRIARRERQCLRIGDDVVIEVLQIEGNQVRLGISAPREVPVYREEVWLAVQEENLAAAVTLDD